MRPIARDEKSRDGLIEPGAMSNSLSMPSGASASALPSISHSSTYRAVVEAAVWRQWGEELAVYESRAAETHLLVDGHAELFRLLAARPEPLSIGDLAREFEGDVPSGDTSTRGESAPQSLSDAELATLESLVQELVTLGLVEAIPASAPFVRQA